MVQSGEQCGFQVAAVVLGGTLLGADHGVSSARAAASRRRRQVGATVMLAPGCHSISLCAESLPGSKELLRDIAQDSTDVAGPLTRARTEPV